MASSAPVPIYQHAAEFDELLRLYWMMAPARVLEIGTYHGGTLWHWLQNAAEGAVVVTVDSYRVGVDNRALYESWKPRGVTCVAIEGDSRDPETIAKVRSHGPYDWLFIDAGHYDSEVRADFANYEPLVRSGGVIALHDIISHPSHPEIQVEPLWRELQRVYKTHEIIANPQADWGGIGVLFVPSMQTSPSTL